MQSLYQEELRKIKESLRFPSVKDAIFIVAAILLGVIFDWKTTEIIIFSIFISAILKSFPSRIMIIPSIFFLSLAAALLFFDRTAKAEEYAVYAYYFLAMTVILAILETRKNEDPVADLPKE